MQELIKIDFSEKTPVVSARTLHEYLEVGTQFKDWFPRMCEYGFTEGVDFNSLKIERVQNEGGRLVTRKVDDAALSIDMAKEICMIQRTERGKQARQYFIEAEKNWKNSTKPMTQLEIIAAQAQALVDHERRMNAIEETTKALDEKIDAAAVAFMAPSFSVETWRTETKASISAIVESEKLSYGIYTGELYKKLENVAGCNLADRQTRMKNRMRKEGATVSQCSMVTKLYIISLDQKLRAIFDHIMVQEKASRLMKGGIAHA